jgi:hypothetical protein
MLALSRRAAPKGIDGGDKVRVQVLDVRVEWSNDRSSEEMGKRRTGDGRIGPLNRGANVADQVGDGSVVAHLRLRSRRITRCSSRRVIRIWKALSITVQVGALSKSVRQIRGSDGLSPRASTTLKRELQGVIALLGRCGHR